MSDSDPVIPTPPTKNLTMILVVAGYSFILVSLAIFPLVFLFLAFSLGIILLSSKEPGHGFAIIVVSMLATLIRMGSGR